MTNNRPTFSDLVHVIAVGEAQEHEDITVTLYSLELYIDGIRVNFGSTSFGTRLPEFILNAQDDYGTTYHSTGGGGFGGKSVKGQWFHRLLDGLTPALASGARTLKICFTVTQWYDTASHVLPRDRFTLVETAITP